MAFASFLSSVTSASSREEGKWLMLPLRPPAGSSPPILGTEEGRSPSSFHPRAPGHLPQGPPAQTLAPHVWPGGRCPVEPAHDGAGEAFSDGNSCFSRTPPCPQSMFTPGTEPSLPSEPLGPSGWVTPSEPKKHLQSPGPPAHFKLLAVTLLTSLGPARLWGGGAHSSRQCRQ